MLQLKKRQICRLKLIFLMKPDIFCNIAQQDEHLSTMCRTKGAC